MLKIEHREEKNKSAYDDSVIRLWVDLPSGRRLYFDAMDCEYDTPEQEREKIEAYKAELLSMLAELPRE